MRAESFFLTADVGRAQRASWAGVPLLLLTCTASGCPSTALVTSGDSPPEWGPGHDSGSAPDAAHVPSDAGTAGDAGTAIDAATVIDAAGTVDAARDVDATWDATDAGDASMGAWDASLADAAPDAPDLSGLPDFGASPCTETPMPNHFGTMGSCPPRQWELHGDLVVEPTTSSEFLGCMETAEIPTDGDAFADYVEREYPRSGFAGYTTEDPPVFERRTACAYGRMYYYTDTPIGGLIHLHWTYVAP